MLKGKLLSALRVVRLLKHGPATSKQIAAQLGVGVSYVEQLCALLVQGAGIIEGRRGPGGGYTLSADLDKIAMEDVYGAIYKRDPVMRLPISVNDGLKLLAPDTPGGENARDIAG